MTEAHALMTLTLLFSVPVAALFFAVGRLAYDHWLWRQRTAAIAKGETMDERSEAAVQLWLLLQRRTTELSSGTVDLAQAIVANDLGAARDMLARFERQAAEARTQISAHLRTAMERQRVSVLP